METTAEKNQITGILSLPQFLYVLSWVIERKHQRPHPQLQGLWIQAIFLLSEHNLGHLLLWLSTNSRISDKNKKESKISSIAYIFRKSTHSSFFSCLLCRLWYLEGCVQCTKLPFEHWSWTSFHDLPWIWTFFLFLYLPSLWNCDSFG